MQTKEKQIEGTRGWHLRCALLNLMNRSNLLNVLYLNIIYN
jgi:hypothetical protein